MPFVVSLTMPFVVSLSNHERPRDALGMSGRTPFDRLRANGGPVG